MKKEDSQITGMIFSTQKFSIHDGSGIRTLIFFKGCPLACRWCSNPESQTFQPVHAFNPKRCLTTGECGRCIAMCPTGAIALEQGGFIRFDEAHCTSCGKCVKVCPGGAQTLYGEQRTVGELIRIAEEDDIFYQRSGGGITLSGGEPMAQPTFALALLREARKARLHTMMETCGYCSTEHLDAACRLLGGLIMDVKTLDAKRHKEFTGKSNERVLANLEYVLGRFPELPLTVRTPVIPGFNDREEEILAIRSMLPRRVHYEILTYHRMGVPKYAYLGRPWLMGDVQADESFMGSLRVKLAAMDEGEPKYVKE